MPNRFLVGLRQRPQWQNVILPAINIILPMPIREIAIPYLQEIDQIGERELVAIPQRIVHPYAMSNLHVPRSAQAAEDHLSDAFFRQRYLIPTEGGEVRFRNALDVERMILIQNRNLILAKTVTEGGDLFTSIHLDTGRVFNSDLGLIDNFPLGDLVAEVYHDLVTAVEIPTTRFRNLGARGTANGLDVETPQIIYIPRIARTGQIIDRPPYNGPDRPNRPHRVSGHRRRANMTEAQRQRILDFQEVNDINILNHLPAGFTFVRPFTVPAGANIRNLPQFIKRRIETQLAQRLQMPIVD